MTRREDNVNLNLRRFMRRFFFPLFRSTEDPMPTEPATALISNDIVGLGLIAATLALIFWAASGPTPLLKKIFAWVPALLLCYFIPAIYNTAGVIDGHNTSLYNPVARDVLLPAALVLLTLSIDLKGVIKLGPKLLLVFCAGTAGIMLGAIVSFQLMKLIHPETVAGDTWAGMAALAGSWIGGGANMVAMREVFGTDATTFGQFAVVDVACASLWMAILLFLANRAQQIDTRNGADTRAIDEMKARISAYEAQNARIPSMTDLMVIVGVALGGVGLAHAIAAPLSGWFKANVSWASQFSLDSQFVWVILLSTAMGLGLSFTRARRLEAAGASRLGTVFLYFLIACIGMQMNLLSLLDRPWLFLLGAIWMATHVLVLWIVAKLLRAPLFFFAIGSQGNIGAAASAPVVAAAFHPTLAPVGVLLGTVGYATGTGLAYVTGLILKWMATG
ncbi:inner membrane protein [Stenotrophomonas sp. SKA14]|nr:inner membrane protein [Stenotrophomonas sp. SKA14]